jgi:hypothetical protein
MGVVKSPVLRIFGSLTIQRVAKYPIELSPSTDGMMNPYEAIKLKELFFTNFPFSCHTGGTA